MPGYEKKYVGLNTNIDVVLEDLKAFFTDQGFKIKSLNKKKGIMEVQTESDVDKSYGKISFIGNPNDYVARVDWEATLRKVFWINFSNKLHDQIKKNSNPEKQGEIKGESWSPSEEVIGKLDWRRVPDDPELAKLRKEAEKELDGKRSVLLAQAETYEMEGEIKEALKLYKMAIIISKDLGENVYAEMFESKINELQKK
ncbi:MAG: hypothetical protein KIH08_03330 [Candidatus Freyarchaeota archaeon]|nr:hypothetical protein [Candidatus Jordarchaeia archaeon]MBS7269020.1 hypothetical protein [Candidatus Jordarchaeia archaeon]MBS7280892.1 hypothetical protein [Candidatus Jordarchaeia archaeon]